MKKSILKKALSTLMVMVMLLQLIPTIGVYASDELPSAYKKAEAFADANHKGEQGYDGWYYVYKESESADYTELTWDGNETRYKTSDSAIFVDTNFIKGGVGKPAAVAWKAPYSGTVELRSTDNIIYRSGANADGGNVTATIKLNNEIVKYGENQANAQWIFDNTCSQSNGSKAYVVENLQVKKGDIIYHEVYCEKNNLNAGIYWKPEVTYTKVDKDDAGDTGNTDEIELPNPYKKAEAFADANHKGEQGYDGWYYVYKESESADYTELTWDGNETRYKTSDSAIFVDTNFIKGGVGKPAAVAWKAPYSGTVELRSTDNIIYRSGANADGGNVTATIKLNNEIVKYGENQANAQWIFDNTCSQSNGSKAYVVENLQVKKGDIIYHEVYCEKNNLNAGIYWKPEVTYTKIGKDDNATPTPTPTPGTGDTDEIELPNPYKKVEAFANCNGEQGYEGWYYLYKTGENAYTNMTWNGDKFSEGDNNVNVHSIQPACDRATAIGWKATYTGTVTLSHTDIVYRMSAYASGGDVTATIKLNGEIVKQNDGTEAKWIFNNTCNNSNGVQTYKIENVNVKKGDVIYFEVDCGNNNAASDIYWKPEVTYTKIGKDDNATPTPTPTPGTGDEDDNELPSTYKKTDAFANHKGEQGYDGWYYLYKPTGNTEYIELTWDQNENRYRDKGSANENTIFVDSDYIKGQVGQPAAVAWKAPYTGTVKLHSTDNIIHRSGANPDGGNVTATIRLNNDIVQYGENKANAQWIFDNTCSNSNGSKAYLIENLHVNKGDIIYHEVYCEKNNLNAGIYWKPEITYTDVEFSVDGDGTKENPYLITSSFDVKVLSEISKTSENAIFAKLTKDITMSRSGKIEEFNGTIDGNKCKITLAGNPLIEKATGNVAIKNLMIDGTVTGSENKASFIGYTDNATVSLENCANIASVTADNNAAGFVGLVKENDSVKMTNCYNYGTVISKGATVNPYANKVANATEEYINCYYLENSAKYNSNQPYNSGVATSKTTSEFQCGEVAYKLGGAFGQKLTAPVDKYPVFRTDSNAVYKKGNEYSNTLLETSDLTYNMSKSYPSDGVQGKGNWYYTYKDPESGEYINLKWYSNGNDKRFVTTDKNGNITNFVTINGIMQPAGGVPTDVGWKAPMSGKVRLTTTVPIRKVSKGAAVGVKIILNDEILWQESIPGDLTDEKLGKTYDVVVDVNMGETIHFQVDCTDATSAAPLWVPQVQYLQVAKFMSDGEIISSPKEIKSNKPIECIFYDENRIEKDALVYLAAYDENGSMRKISTPFELSGGGNRGCTVSFDADFDEEIYENWQLRLMVINGDGININPVIKPELYCLK